jgi:hypothetical protein
MFWMTTKTDNGKNTPTLLAFLITMEMQQYNAGHIDQWSTSQASLEATRCSHWVSAWEVLPQQPPWWTILNETQNH